MRRTYISPEFNYKKVHGSFNMSEHSSFFGSKMLEIDDSLNVTNDNIIYYQQPSGEQSDLNSEKSLPQVVYDAVSDKKNNQKLILDDAQSESDKNGTARWILDIQLQSVLRDYIFATMKKWRTFEGVLNTMTINNNVDAAIREYIDKNVLNRYSFTKVELFIKSVDLLTVGGLKYDNKFDFTIESPSTLYTKFQTETDANNLDIRLKFYQPLPANQYAFNYYYNLYFEKL